MKRLLTFTVLLVILMGGMVLATETRVNTMGNVNTVVKDEANIFLFPSTINYYPKLFAAEFGERNNLMKDGDEYDVYLNRVGAHFQFGQKSEKPWVLGAYFDTRTYVPDIVDEYVFDYFTKDADEGPWGTNHRITMVYGREISAIPFGFIFSYYNSGSKVDNDTVYIDGEDFNYDRSLNRYEFSFGLSPMQKKLDLGLMFAFTSWKDKYAYDEALGLIDATKPKGNMDIALTGRYWMDPMGKYTLVPHAGFMYRKEGVELYEVSGDPSANALYETVSWKYTAIDLGLGLNYDASQNVLVVGDMGVNMQVWKDKYEYAGSTTAAPEPKWTDMMLPYFRVGIDAEAFKWMNLRAGVVAQWFRTKYEPVSSRQYKGNFVETETFLGAGFHWGSFYLDANIDPDFLSRGPYFITGSNDYNEYDISNKISLKYLFD